MIEERELVILLLSTGALVLGGVLREPLRHVPHRGLLFAAGTVWWLGQVVTVAEGFSPTGLAGLLDVLEHGCYLAYSLLLLGWTWRWVKQP